MDACDGQHEAGDDFDAIRPYRDDEVDATLAALVRNGEFLDTIARYRLKRLSRLTPRLARSLVRRRLQRTVRHIHSIDDFQNHIAHYMAHMIDTTTTTFTVEGLDKLDRHRAHLFIGNHRDIALDPAFVNYALYQSGLSTVRIAIGDNLLQKSWVNDLMRLNKSFIVPRSARGKRAMLAAYQQLSNYIHRSITVDNHPIWMAQREGRAKNGIDRTDTAIIKMLDMARRMQGGGSRVGDAIGELRMVPVSISYEFDPCDLHKARELKARTDGESYQKIAYEDILSIAAGITGFKGRVKLVFGTPLSAEYDDYATVAEEIDRQVLSGYTLFPSHHMALEATGAAPELVDLAGITPADRRAFEQRLAGIPPELRDQWLCQYANPVLNRAGHQPL
ncbi:1-acyl-sn-glycerol-3-phosphate acyltransferase [Kushneria aurantia]|uniref:1-acyl-sn-glycerol-3-phosphate acyltransferase n=1 Tax=Kushneria aurantia TaxID=504092 RepID=A0ABV6G035_9GAMM|nr:1-acyl-sn-glycerol-3-phosphate acyltransferase [Kushneria aurantia]